MKQVLIILLLFGLVSCEKNLNKIPQLTDLNPKVSIIKVPGPVDYHLIEVTYDGELINSISRSNDSIKFFYKGGLLESAIRYSWINSNINDTELVTFERDLNNKILIANFGSIVFPNNTFRFSYIYDSDNLVALKSYHYSSGDTIIYDLENNITEIQTRSFDYGPNILEHFGFLMSKTTIKSYNDRPNPYYLISQRIGFPYFSSVMNNALGDGEDYYKDCIVDYEIYNKQFGQTIGKLGYDYDYKGRVKAIYNEDKPNLKILIEYK